MAQGAAARACDRPAFLDDVTAAELAGRLRAGHKAGAELRDTDVLAGALATAGDDASVLARRVNAERTRKRTRGEASRLLSAHARAIETLPEEFATAVAAGIGVDELARALAKSYRRVRQAARRAVRTRAPRDVHTFRRRVKALQHQLELAETVRGFDVGDARREAAKLAQTLGEITDAQLVERVIVDSREGLSARARKRLIGTLAAQRTKRLDRAFVGAEPLTAVRPRQFRRLLLTG